MEENQEKQKLQTILAQLTKDQLRFIVALQEYHTKDAAAKAIGIKVATVYNWSAELIDEAARLMALDVATAALELRKRNLIKAMGVKAAGLDSKNENVRQKASTEIIEWEMGKAEQPIKGNLEIGIKHVDYRNGIPVPADGSSDDSETSGKN